jgi:hypothetical protein
LQRLYSRRANGLASHPVDIPRPLADRGARETDRFIETWLASPPEGSDEGWTRSELEEHLREEHSTFSWLLEPMLDRAGFEIREASYDWARIYAAYVFAKRR